MGCLCQASSFRHPAGCARPRRHPDGRRRQSRHRRTGMRHLTHRIGRVSTGGRRRSDSGADRGDGALARPGAAGAAAGQAVCRTSYRLAALGQRSAETGPRDQRRQQSPEILRSRQGRDRGGGVRSGHRSAAPGECQPQAGRKPGRARRAGRCVPEYRRYHRARNRQAARHHPRRDAGPGRRRTNSVADRKRVYTGSA